MRTLDGEARVQSFALFYEEGRVRIQHSPLANNDTSYLLSKCYERMMCQIVGRGQRFPSVPEVARPPFVPSSESSSAPVVLAEAAKPAETSLVEITVAQREKEGR